MWRDARERVLRASESLGRWQCENVVHLALETSASTGTDLTWSAGCPDYARSRGEVLGHLAALNEATDLLANADFGADSTDDPERVVESASLAIATLGRDRCGQLNLDAARPSAAAQR